MFDTQKLAKGFMPGGDSALRQIFRAQGAPAPSIVWSPSLADLDHPMLRQFYDRCAALPQTAGGIAWDDFSLDWFAGLEDWLMVLEHVQSENAFRYRRYGQGIADTYGKDMTGARIDDFGGHIAQFFSVIYRAAQIRKESVYTEHEPPRQVLVHRWLRLIVPLMSAAEVRGFVVINAPDNAFRAGLELVGDPIFLMDDDQQVLFGNRAARALFPGVSVPGGDKDLFALTGIALKPDQSALELAASRAIQDDVQITFRNAIVDHFQLSLSATIFHNRAFYVLQVRTVGP